MTKGNAKRHTRAAEDGWFSRERALALALLVLTAIAMYLCYRLMLPFLPALAWALALAVMAHPMHRRIHNWVGHSTISASLAVLVVVVAIVIPVIFVTQNLIREAEKYSRIVQQELESGQWRSAMAKNPRLKPVLRWIDTRINGKPADPSSEDPTQPSQSGGEAKSEQTPDKSGQDSAIQPDAQAMPTGVAQVERAASMLSQGVGSVVSGTIWLMMQLFITALSLFFFFRDQRRVIEVLRSFMPLSDSETDEVFTRVDDTIHATIYGCVVVAFIQGAMGGLMFWLLGLPSPLMWGTIMALLAVVPVLGTFVVWAPTATYLAMTGEWGRALALAAWGGIAIGLIDNFLYPFLVGKRLRFHTLIVFFAIVGGLALFGVSGIILGPLIMAIADALLDVWRRRTAFGGTIEGGLEPET